MVKSALLAWYSNDLSSFQEYNICTCIAGTSWQNAVFCLCALHCSTLIFNFLLFSPSGMHTRAMVLSIGGEGRSGVNAGSSERGEN